MNRIEWQVVLVLTIAGLVSFIAIAWWLDPSVIP